MIFAVSMTFIDQTIVSIAAPHIQEELHLTSTGVQWGVNAYLLVAGRAVRLRRPARRHGRPHEDGRPGRRRVRGSLGAVRSDTQGCRAEAWLVAFRALQGVGGAIMFPAALAIVVQTFPLHERGKALALFFGIAGGLTPVGPALGGFLTQWTWRAIFWVNIPVARRSRSS